jgi:hypothetical protein
MEQLIAINESTREITASLIIFIVNDNFVSLRPGISGVEKEPLLCRSVP